MIIEYPITAGGRPTRVLEAGRGPREMWLVHDIGGRADDWRRCMEGLADGGYRVRAFDLVGHGFAGWYDDFDFTIGGYSRFVRDVLLDNVEDSTTTVVGAGLGGQLALCASLDLMRRDWGEPSVETLVLCAPTGLRELGVQRRIELAERISRPSRQAFRARLAAPGMSLPTLDAMVEEELRIATSPGRSMALTRIARMIRYDRGAEPLVDDLGELTELIPALEIWGQRDRSQPIAEFRTVSQDVPAAGPWALPAAGDLSYLRSPERFAELVLNFLAKRPDNTPVSRAG